MGTVLRAGETREEALGVGRGWGWTMENKAGIAGGYWKVKGQEHEPGLCVKP